MVDGCIRLGKRYGFDQAHGELVASLAMSLFDDMAGFHGFGERERLLLRTAALLHDVGDYVSYGGHHKHSYYLIQHSDIMGLTPGERAIVANVARYHRKSPPDPSHPNFRDLDKEARAKVRSLSAILRIADALDREHLGKVKSVRARDRRQGRKMNLVIDRRRGARARRVDRARQVRALARRLRSRRDDRRHRNVGAARDAGACCSDGRPAV